MNIKRYKDIIAFKAESVDANIGPSVIAFHGSNLEIAEISSEAFSQMADVSVTSSMTPTNLYSDSNTNSTKQAADQLETWNNEVNPEVRPGNLSFGIKSLTLNVTQICNLKCSYCAAGGDGTYGDPVTKIEIEKTIPQLKFFLESLKPNSQFNLSFVGGEPLLYPEAIQVIYDYITHFCNEKEIKCRFMMTTNGTLISEKILEMLKNRPMHITVSLDGKKEINDVVRSSKNQESSTELTLKGLKKLNSIKSHLASLGIAAVFSENHLDVLESYRFFRSLDVDWYEFNFSYSENSKKAQTIFIQQMQYVAAEAWQIGQELELRRIKTFNQYFETFDSQQRIENFCGAGKSYLMIDAKNQLYTCPWVVGKTSEIVGKNTHIDYDKLDKYQKPLIELNNCQSCWAKFVCGGGCMFINSTHNQDKHKKDELFCERTRSLILMAIMYYKLARA